MGTLIRSSYVVFDAKKSRNRKRVNQVHPTILDSPRAQANFHSFGGWFLAKGWFIIDVSGQ